MLHMQTPQSSNKWIFVVCHHRETFSELGLARSLNLKISAEHFQL